MKYWQGEELGMGEQNVRLLGRENLGRRRERCR